jgi:hypothetical protein
MMKKAQSTIEFTFAMVVVVFLIYGMVMVFRWAGMDLANRRISQDNSLTYGSNPYSQLNPGDDYFLPIGAVYHGKITNGNTSQ